MASADDLEMSVSDISPEEIEGLISQRAEYRRSRAFEKADQIKTQLEKNGILLSDIPYKQGGGSTWFRKTSPPDKVYLYALSVEVFGINNKDAPRVQEIVAMAKKYLIDFFTWRQKSEVVSHDHDMTGRKYADIAFNFAMGGVDDCQLFSLLTEGHSAEISRFGHRKSCGVMDLVQMTEKLACAGVIDQNLFQLVGRLVRAKDKYSTCRSLGEIESGRYSLLSDHPLRILWRFAAKQSKHGRQRKLTADRESTGSQEWCESDVVGDDGEEGSSDDDASANDLWDESEDGVGSGELSSLRLSELFLDSTLPVVLDLGCGFGVAQIGVCVGSLIGEDGSLHKIELNPQLLGNSDEDDSEIAVKRPRTEGRRSAAGSKPTYNFLGCDLSARAVGFASGISRRWGIAGCCAFIRSDVSQFMQWVHRELDRGDYRGPVSWVSVNFPTPYSQGLMADVIRSYCPRNHVSATEYELIVDNDKEHTETFTRGNSQLPGRLSHFMVTPSLVRQCADLFRHHGLGARGVANRVDAGATNGVLYLQSNAEDVSVVMNWIVQQGATGQTGSGKFVAAGEPSSAVTAAEVRKLWQSLQQQEEEQHDSCSDGISGGSSGHMQSAPFDGQKPPGLTKRQVVWRDALIAARLPVDGVKSSYGWSQMRPFTTSLGLTETEAVYNHSNKPVYRLVYAHIGN